MKKNKKTKVLLFVLIVIFLVSIFFIAKHLYDAKKQAELYDNLKALSKEDSSTEALKYSEGRYFLPEYQELFLKNTDMVGWIKIEGTEIDYPVMQSKNSPDYYLDHNFDKDASAYGCPYVQEDCDVMFPSDNIIIYGHHMKDGSMFAGLLSFEDEAFWEEHRTVSFDTLTDRQTYEIMAVFKTAVYTDDPSAFGYYRFVNANTAKDFEDYVSRCKALSLYETGVTADYGDKLITLSTCEYSQNNGRFVVIAKLVRT